MSSRPAYVYTYVANNNFMLQQEKSFYQSATLPYSMSLELHKLCAASNHAAYAAVCSI